MLTGIRQAVLILGYLLLTLASACERIEPQGQTTEVPQEAVTVVDEDDITNTAVWTSEVSANVGDTISLDLTITDVSLRDPAYGLPPICTDPPVHGWTKRI